MRILFVSPNLVPMPPLFGGAIEEHIWQLANALAKDGVETAVVGNILPRYNENNITSFPALSYNLFPLEFPRVIPLHLFQGLRSYRAYRKAGEYDVVSLHEEVSSALILKSTRGGMGYVYTFHNPFSRLGDDLSPDNLLRYSSFTLSRWAVMRKVGVVFVPSRYYCRLIRGMGVGNAVYLPQVVDTLFFSPDRFAGRSSGVLSEVGVEERKYAVFVGRLSFRKGAHLLPLLSRVIDVVAVGEGPLRRSLSRYPNIRCVGRVSRDRMAMLLSNALVSLNLSQLDMVSYTLLESMSCGVPVVASSIPTFREAIREGENGYLINIHDAKAMLHRFREIVKQEQLEEVGRKARDYVVKNHSPEVCARIFLNYCRTLRGA